MTHKPIFPLLLPSLAAALVLLPFAPAFSQTAPNPYTSGQANASQTNSDQYTGTSHPDQLNDTITATDSLPQQQAAKPSPAVPAQPSAEVYTNTYVPYKPGLQTRAAATNANSDHYVPPSGSNGSSGYTQAPVHPFNPDDINSGVVTDVPTGPNDLPIGTHITALLNDDISTRSTPQGWHFVAALATPVMHNGNVLLPAGTLITGRITQIHGGRRISGASAIRLQPDQLVLPDRTLYHLNAEVVELDHFHGSHVGREGTIIQNTDKAKTAAEFGIATGSSMVVGAMVGGAPGALVGAGIGAGVGTVWWLRQDHQQTLPKGTEIVFSLNEPVHIATAAGMDAGR